VFFTLVNAANVQLKPIHVAQISLSVFICGLLRKRQGSALPEH